MPTGYTAMLEEREGVTLREFAMRCARGHGMLISMIDASPNATIPDLFEPPTHYLEAIKAAKKRLAKLEKMTIAQAEAKALKAYRGLILGKERNAQENRKFRKVYNAMLNEVMKWTPPTEEHVNLKDFMVQQLTTCLEGFSPSRRKLPTRVTGKKYRAQLIAVVQEEIAYMTRLHEKERALAQKATEWVRALRQSLDASSK